MVTNIKELKFLKKNISKYIIINKNIFHTDIILVMY